MMLIAWLLVASPALEDCLSTGFCRQSDLEPGPFSGLRFVATGLLMFGVMGLWSGRRSSRRSET